MNFMNVYERPQRRLMIRTTLNSQQYYCVQLIGNKDSMKRMVVSLYLVNGNKQQQTLKVCICDDLPHVVYAVGRLHKPAPAHDELESGLTLQVAHDRGLSISVSLASGEDNELCVISPPKVVLPSSAIWEPNAAFATDFQLQLTRMNVEAKLGVTITAQDDQGGDLPLNVSSRVHVKWQPNYRSGVRDMRRKWEESNQQQLTGSSTLPRGYKPRGGFQQPAYQDIDRLLNMTNRKMFNHNHNNNNHNHIAVKQDQNWNVVTSPTSTVPDDEEDELTEASALVTSPMPPQPKSATLPTWARNGLNEDDFNYDDVIVV